MENLALHLLILGTVNDTTIARSELLRDTSHIPVPKELTQRLQTLGYASSQEARRQIIQKELYKRGAVWALRDIPSSLFLFLLEETKAGPSPSKESCYLSCVPDPSHSSMNSHLNEAYPRQQRTKPHKAVAIGELWGREGYRTMYFRMKGRARIQLSG